MRRELQSFCLRLWRDESGVVLATTVVVFLTLFMIACTVYSVGDTVRQKIELQNAADAAAYSAALVQADALSRIAALNRAMAWTYMHMCRYEQDYIVDKWLEKVVQKFWPDYNQARQYNFSGNCNLGDPNFFWAGISQGENKKILLNQRHHESIQTIEQQRQQAAGKRKSYNALSARIDDCRENIKKMIQAQKDIIEVYPKKLGETCREILKANIQDTVNDRDAPAGGADIRFKLLPKEGDHKGYFEIEKDELAFLGYIDKKPENLQMTPGGGENRWWKLKSGPIRRGYEQQGNRLLAEWSWWSSRWQMTKAGCVLVGTQGPNRNSVKGQDVYTEKYFNTEPCEPQKLTKDYFAGKGTIVVGVARRLNNPWQFVVAGRGAGDRGIFDASSVDRDQRFMWAAAAARAGHRFKDGAKGEYQMTYWNVGPDDPKHWNIKRSDWDAELLPLRRARTPGEDGRWTGGPSGGALLQELSGGGWEALSGSGGGLGTQSAPALMRGGTVNYGGAENWIRH